MKLSESDLRPLLLNPKIRESDFIKEIAKISERFTTKRQNISDYVLSEDSVSAYTLFYLPTNMQKLNFLFRNLDQAVVKSILSSHFIDYGAGPGTYTVAFLDECKSAGLSPLSISLVDTSELMRRQSRKLLDGLSPLMEMRISDRYMGNTEGPQTLLFGNSLNEMSDKDFFQTVSNVSPDFIIFIEPGTKELFARIQKIRSDLIRSGFNILYPCQNNEKCPINAKENWCHQVLFTTHDSSIERLSQLLKLDRRSMPMAIHLYAKEKSETVKKTVFRILSETKFSYEFEVCAGDIFKIQIMKKDLSKETKKSVEGFSVGDRINYEVVKELENNFLRVKLL